MNDGNNQQDPARMGLQLFPADGLVGPEEFARNLDQIRRAYATLATIEAENREGYVRYLESRAVVGRQAELQLAQLRALGQQQAQPQLAPARPQSAARPGRAGRTQRAKPGEVATLNLPRNAPPVQQLPPLTNVADLPPHKPILQPPQQGSQTPSIAPSPYPVQPYYRDHVYQNAYRPGDTATSNQGWATSRFHVSLRDEPQQNVQPNAGHTPNQVASGSSIQAQHQPTNIPHATVGPEDGPPGLFPSQYHNVVGTSVQEPIQASSSSVGITRAKNTYSSRTSQNSATANASVDRRAVLEAIAIDTFMLVKGLSPDILRSVNYSVYQQLKFKLDPNGQLRTDPAPPTDERVAQDVATIASAVASKLEDLSKDEILLLWSNVTKQVVADAKAATFGPTASGNGSRASPIVIDANSQQFTPTVNTPPLNASQSAQATVPADPTHPPHGPTAVTQSSITTPASLGAMTSSATAPPVQIMIPPAVQPIALPIVPPVATPSAASSAPSTPQSGRHLTRPPNPTTLARDILRSLGRPHRASQESSEDSKKRKRVPSNSLAGKKQKTNEQAPVTPAAAAVPPPLLEKTATPAATVTAAGTAQVLEKPQSTSTSGPALPEAAPSAQQRVSPEHVEEIITPGAEQAEAAIQHDLWRESIRNFNAALEGFSRPQDIQPPPQITPSISTPSVQDAPALVNGTAVPVGPSQGPLVSAEPPAAWSSEAEHPMDVDAVLEVRSQGPTTPRQAVASSSKTPLFLPSRSPSDTDSPQRTNRADGESKVETEDFVPTGLLGIERSPTRKDKGKQRATEGDVEMQSPLSPQRLSARRKQRVSSEDVEVIETSDVDEARAQHKPRGRRPKLQPYILLPPIPAAAVRINARLADQVEEEDGRRAVMLSLPRLVERHCCWTGCDAVLNSAERLGLHVQQHAGENAEWNSFTCQWENCPEFYSNEKKLAAHLKKHTYNTLLCAYAGCDHSYSTSKDLARHHISEHEGDALKPTAALTTLQVTDLPALPDELPSYMTVPRRVAKHPMSREVHVWLGAKVGRSICFTPVLMTY
ncbi:hypothetical protein NM688_g7033 [Phlebia brevispora]|uniref:Uncharacterized protein n=1 Tax=Phlebia brevispora TaxID=194682 RepID=A0ACC1S9R0_9APHY|nr:hypothetical protein NM688_g7033 [Phlebia brevispora]